MAKYGDSTTFLGGGRKRATAKKDRIPVYWADDMHPIMLGRIFNLVYGRHDFSFVHNSQIQLLA